MARTALPAVILAGGAGRRLGGVDKALVALEGRPLIAHVVDRLAGQVSALAISANGDPERFGRLGLPVLPDPVPDRPGPLAGVLAGLDWARAAYPKAPRLLTVPVDCPLLPADLVARLLAAGDDDHVVMAASGGKRHPVVALWPVGLATALRAGLRDGTLRKVETFGAARPHAVVEWPTVPFDPFFNVNTPKELVSVAALRAIPPSGGGQPDE